MALEYILDGYNIVKSVDVLADLSLEEGRKALLQILNTQKPQGSSRNSVVVVFDGRPDVWGKHPSGVANVVFTSGETADAYIKKYIERKPNAKNRVVVTNDGEIRCYVSKLGAQVLSVERFLGFQKRAAGRKKTTPGRREGSPNRKPVSRREQKRINDELEDIWIRSKKNKQEKK